MDNQERSLEEDDARALSRTLRTQQGAVARRQVPDPLWWRVRWALESDRWQRAHPGLFVNHSGRITTDQRRWLAVLGGGEGAALCGPTAAEVAGLEGFETGVVHVAIPYQRAGPRIAGVRYHRLRSYETQLAPNREPARIELKHALIAMAVSALTEARAHEILAASVQQGLVRSSDLRDALASKARVRRRRLMHETLLDIDDGAQSLNEIAMLQLVSRHGLPKPQLQISVATDQRRARLDGGWPEYGVYFEIDGVGHMDVTKWIDDADRQNEVALERPAGTTLLRWPGFVVRNQPQVVLDQVQRALRRGRRRERDVLAG